MQLICEDCYIRVVVLAIQARKIFIQPKREAIMCHVDFRQAIVLFFVLGCHFVGAQAQSSSVVDANYFDTEDGKQPPLRIGKGFDITDTYRQTRFCFTQASADPASLTRQENSQKTSITLHYTKTESEYQTLKTNGRSGKVSFLNLFSFGSSTLEKYGVNEIKENERLVFIAKVDFGKFEFGSDPQLTPEAKALVDEKNSQQFISLYGTHYISGVRKEASVYVVMKRRKTTSGYANVSGESFGIKTPIPLKGTLNFEVADENSVNKALSVNEFDIEIILEGPALNETDIQEGIKAVLASSDAEKVSAIKSLISRSLSGLSDPNSAKITQYYFSPFSLYNVEGIVWDSQKETKLINLNQLVVRAYQTKTKIQNYASPDYLSRNLEAVSGIEDLEGGADWVARYKTTYNSIKPRFQKHLGELTGSLTEIEKIYLGCSAISCDASPTCCNFSGVDTRVGTSAANAENDIKQIEKVEMEAYDILKRAAEAEQPDCQKEEYGIVSVVNHSYNPYTCYVNGAKYKEIPGKQTLQIALAVGSWQIKAEQVSGYLFYPTVNNRVAVIENVCDEVVLQVGFED